MVVSTVQIQSLLGNAHAIMVFGMVDIECGILSSVFTRSMASQALPRLPFLSGNFQQDYQTMFVNFQPAKPTKGRPAKHKNNLPVNPSEESYDDYEMSYLSPKDCGIRRWVNEQVARRVCEKNQAKRSKRSEDNIQSDDSSTFSGIQSNDTSTYSEEDSLEAGVSSDNNTTPYEMAARVVGGLTCDNMWPWMVALSNNGQFVCGGSVIDNWHILTAAHCFDKRLLDPDQWKINVGELKREDAKEYEVEDIHLHEGYKPMPHFTNDIAVMRLKTSLPDEIVPICLPSEDNLKVGDETTVIGWGRLSEEGDFAERLQELHGLKIVDKNKCARRLEKVGQNFKGVKEYQICAGGDEEGGRDACQGDSGGPLIRMHDGDRWFQEGVVSYGYGCARPGLPGLYTKVVNYIDWLDEYMYEDDDYE